MLRRRGAQTEEIAAHPLTVPPAGEFVLGRGAGLGREKIPDEENRPGDRRRPPEPPVTFDNW
jgi:hypothetical protein